MSGRTVDGRPGRGREEASVVEVLGWRGVAGGSGRPECWCGVRSGGAVEVLSWTTDAGRRFKQRLCGRESGGEVESLIRTEQAPPGRPGTRAQGRWSGGVLEVL